ncbi:hypothetical protein [Rhodovulum euryhalinum]|uniref:Lipoprotein n=1 Tax=Rhodovulum euryhalinum TaxID=35805 RepID=A0A4R2KJ37_9RHOB|nr:hypothetical protein [Rhodovulum euryhalinum]TCO72522.1 hypothetical protein EV655_104211 [Rhodovulum euryhalinum]
MGRSRHPVAPVVALALMAGAGGCAPAAPEAAGQPDARAPAYLGVETAVLSADLVNMVVRMRDPEDAAAVEAYARCAAAGFALGQGMSFLRHVRTKTGTEPGGVVTADAVFTMSAALPEGVRPLDAEVVAADCAGLGIPTV